MRLIDRKQMGDTIVEVLLAIAVTSVVLAGAYVAVDRSMKASRAAQERGEAVKVAEAQIERLKYLGSTGAVDIYQAGPFCINSELAVLAVDDVENDEDDGASGCRSSGRYVPSITRDPTNGVHQITVLWENVTGSRTSTAHPGFDEIKMYYRIYQ